MVGRVWRRLGAWFGGEADAPSSGSSGWAQSGPPPANSIPPVPTPRPTPPAPPRPITELAERLTARLAEDESLRRDLTDDEFAPLAAWATRRVEALAGISTRLAPGPAEAYFNGVTSRLLELLRTLNLAIGQRASASPELVRNRLELLDTLLVPPLLDGPIAQRAQADLEALLAEPADRIQALDGPELVRRLVGSLG
jgi:hypothetical protein